MRRLPTSETEVMLALWQAEGPVPRGWLDQKLARHGWSINTVNTYLARLEEKGFVACTRQGRAKLYRPLVQRQEYLAQEGSTVLDTLYNKSLKNFVASLVGAEQVSAQQLAELQEYLNSLKEGDPHA